MVSFHWILGYPYLGGLGATSSSSPSGTTEENAAEMETDMEPDIQPVGQDYIEEMKGDDGKVWFTLHFSVVLCSLFFLQLLKFNSLKYIVQHQI